ncbi:MAG TPA: glycosyltransferase family 39 protein [Streptosporangiaceae bacterium]
MRERIVAAWPLWSLLVAQAVLTQRWIWRTAPFTDEALYLQAGHAEWAHWLHHAPLPDYASWFSGAPVLYPPLAAAADSAGGLAAARWLSLIIMLATATMVYLIGSRTFGRTAGVLAALVFAVCGLVVHYGAFATFGPPSLFLLVAATWAAVRIRGGSVAWLPACAVLLAAANATKYATLAWDPVVVGIIILHGWRGASWRAIGRGASVAVTTAVLDLGFVMFGGPTYARGVIVTTIFRSIHWGAPSSAASVLARAFTMTGTLVLPAIAGVLISILTRRPPAMTALLGLLVLAAVLAPIEQARIHEVSSLDKNMAYGLPFAAIGAGYALSAGSGWLAQRFALGAIAGVAAVIVVVLAVMVSGRYAKVQFRGQGIAAATTVVTAIRQNYRPGTLVLSDGASRVEQYYLPAIPPFAWVRAYTHTAQQRTRLADQIRSCLVSVVVMRMSGRTYDQPYDPAIVRLLNRAGGYKLATVATYGAFRTAVWKLRSHGRSAGGCR